MASLAGAALLFTLAILVSRVLWRWLILLLVQGPPTYAGVVLGHFFGVVTGNAGVGLLVTVVAAGTLGDFACNAYYRAVSPSRRGSRRSLEERRGADTWLAK